MLRFAIISALVVMLVSCGGEGDSARMRADWLEVLSRKKAAAQPDASAQAKQAYADSLAAFVKNHPRHSRARTVYTRIQIDFARELAALGRDRDAIVFYRAALTNDPGNQEAAAGLRAAADRLAISRQKLQALEVGMTVREVAHILGKPLPGWIVRTRRHGIDVEAWYFRTTTGSVAGVYFRDGKLFAAEESTDSRVALITRKP